MLQEFVLAFYPAKGKHCHRRQWKRVNKNWGKKRSLLLSFHGAKYNFAICFAAAAKYLSPPDKLLPIMVYLDHPTKLPD